MILINAGGVQQYLKPDKMEKGEEISSWHFNGVKVL